MLLTRGTQINTILHFVNVNTKNERFFTTDSMILFILGTFS